MQGIEFAHRNVPLVLDGTQTVTHRLVNLVPPGTASIQLVEGRRWTALDKSKVYIRQLRGPYLVNELLYMRECWTLSGGDVLYRADDPDGDYGWADPWMMPVNASRAQIRVVNITTERIRDVDPGDCLREGAWRPPADPPPPSPCGPIEKGECVDADYLRDRFARAWNLLHDDRSGASWSDNPWTWRIEFATVPSQTKPEKKEHHG